VPTRRRRILLPLARPAAPPLAAARKPALIETERKLLFEELAQLRALNGSSARSIETARALLTRWWAKANWRRREKLIEAAAWLIQIECAHGVQKPHA
jgi:hypothetical protein